MTIYPDASFLVSWLYKPDPLNAKARVWFAQHQADDFLISDWSRFETIKHIAGFVFAATSAQARIDRGLEALFLSFAASRPLELTAVDWDVVLKDVTKSARGLPHG